MALSYVEYPSSGSTKAFDLTFGYLSRTHVFAFVNDTLAAYTWVSPTRIELVNIPPENATIKIARLTDRVTRITTFADGQTLLSGDLNAGDLQNFYILQEIADGVADGVVAGTIVVQNPGEGYITEQWIQQQLQAAVGGSEALSDLNTLIDQEVTARNAAILAEQQARAAALVTEANARIAVANDLAAEALARAQGDATEAAARAVVAQNLANEQAARVSAISAEAAARAVVAQNLAAETTARTQAIASEAASRAAALQAEATTRADAVLSLTQADVGLGQRLTTVESDINTASTGLKAKVATLTTTTTDLATNKADASVVTAIDAKIENPTTGLKARATSLESRTTAVETDKASVSSVSAIDAKIEAPTTGLKARATSLESRVSTVETGKASTSVTDAISAEINTPTTGLKARATSLESRVTTVETDKASASALTALTSRVTTAEADIDAVEATNTTQNGRLTTAEGSITTLQTTTSNLQTGKADASVVTALTSRVTTAEADIDAVEAVNVAQGNRLTTAESGITTLNTTTANLATNKADASTVTTLSATVTTVSGVANSKAKTFRQTAAPTAGMQDGDLWIDSDDGNKLYMRVSGVWTAVDDARVATTAANLVTESSARVSADNAQVSRLNSLEATVNTPTTGLSARVTSSESAITDLTTNKASVSSVSAIDAKIETPTTGLAARATSLESRVSTVETGKASTTVTDALSSEINTPTTGLKARATSLETRVTSVETDKATVSSVSAVDAKIETPTTGLKARATSLETRVSTVETGKASTSVTDTLSADLNTPTTGLKARATSLESRVSTVETGKAATTVTDAIDAKIETPTTGLKARATSLETRVTSVETGKAATTVTDAIDAKIETPTTGLKARATSLESRTTAVETNKADASTVTTLSSAVSNIPAGEDAGLDGSFRFGAAYWFNDPSGAGITGVTRTVQERTSGLRVSSTAANSAASGTTADWVRTRAMPPNGATVAPGDIVGARVFAGGSNVTSITLRLAFRDAAQTLLLAVETVRSTGILVGDGEKSTFSEMTVTGTAPANAVSAHLEVFWRPGTAGAFTGRFCEPAVGRIPSLTSAPPRFSASYDASAARLVTAESNITTLQTTTANLNTGKAETSVVTALTARVASGDATGLIRNARFAEALVAGVPAGWSNWANGNTGSLVPRWVHTGGNAFRLAGPVNAGGGLQASSFPANSIRGGSRFRVLIEAVLVSGTYDGSGVYIDWRNASDVALTPDVRIGLANTPDTSGVTSNSAAGFRAWDVEVTAPANAVRANFYVMSHWSSHAGGQAVANSIDWHLVDLVPTSSRLSTAESNITTLQTTTANLNTGKAEASTVTALTSRVSNVAGGVGTVSDFAADGLHWATNFGGSPGTIADAANGATYVNVAGIGRCMEINTFPFYLTPKAAFKPVIGRRYRLTVRFGAGTDATGGNLTVAINNVNGLTELWAHGVPNSTAFAVPGVLAGANVTVAEGFKTIAREWGVTSYGTYDAAWRLRIDVTRSAGSGGTVRIADFRVEDVTDVLAATARGAAAEGSGLVKNSLFQVPFSGTQIPPDWNSFANGSGTQVDRVSGTGKAYRLVSTAGLQSGNQQEFPDGSLKPGRYTLRAKLRRFAGNLDGAAVYVVFRNTANTDLQAFSFPLATTKNTAGETRTDPDGITTWELPVTAPANSSRGVIYFMNHYSPAGSIAATNTIDWYEVDLIPATDADTRVAVAEANITTLQSTTVDLQNNKASATELTSLKASVTPRIGQVTGSLLVNPAFSDYPVASGTVPPGWSDWANGGPPSSRGTGKVGLYAHVRDGNANADSGIYQQRAITPGKYIMKCAIDRLSGDLTAAGVYMQFFNVGGTYIGDKAFAFELTPDTRGNVGVNVGYDYRQFERTFTVPANTTTINVYLMNHFNGGFGSNATYNRIAWHQVDVVAADYGTAEVDILKQALATENSSEARLLLKVNTATNVATIESLAQEGDGVWNGSAIKLNADLIQLFAKSIVFGSNTAFEDSFNTFYTTHNSKRNRWGGPFGAGVDLMEWFGPSTVLLNSETKTNGYWAKGTDGKMYYGGSELGANPLRVSAGAGDYVNTRFGSGSNNPGTITFTASGGVAPYTWTAEVAGKSNPSISVSATAPTGAGTSFTTAVTASAAPTTEVSAVAVITLTDSTGASVQLIKGVLLAWEV